VVTDKLFITVAGVLTAVALTVGVVSAGPGGPDDETAPGEDTATPSPSLVETPEASEDSGSDDESADSEDAEDVEAEEESVAAEGDPAGNQKIAEAIAEEFDTTPEAVLALHDQGIGFGAIFKLYLIARAKGITVEELLAQTNEDGGGFAFGKLKKSLTEDEMAIFEDGPKNLGELVSGSNHDDENEAGVVDAQAAGQESGGSNGGPPEHAKAKGHGKQK
jgi:hypothetical protein